MADMTTVIAVEGDKPEVGKILAQGRNGGLGAREETDWYVIRCTLEEAGRLASQRPTYPADQGKFGWYYTRRLIRPESKEESLWYLAQVCAVGYPALIKAAREGRLEARKSGKTWLSTAKAVHEAIQAGKLRKK